MNTTADPYAWMRGSHTTTAPIPVSTNCPYCGCVQHAGVCPKVKSMDYFPDGALKRVEFWPEAPRC